MPLIFFFNYSAAILQALKVLEADALTLADAFTRPQVSNDVHAGQNCHQVQK